MAEPSQDHFMPPEQAADLSRIEPGMVAETTDGDIGEADLTTPRVAEVVTNPIGDVEKIVVEKGILFKKQIVIPAERIVVVDEEPHDDTAPGKVTIAAAPEETEALAAVGPEDLPTAPPSDVADVATEVEEALPTDVGMRELEEKHEARQQGRAPGPLRQKLLAVLGPGFLAGMAGNDSSAVATYALAGASVGFAQLWLLLLSTPLLFAVQFACAHLGRQQRRGLGVVLRDHYGLRTAAPAALILVLANIALIAADLVAIGSGLELISGVRWVWFIAPVAAGLWYITVYHSFDAMKKIFLIMSLAFVTYIVTAVMARPDWGVVLSSTVVPHLDLSFASISSAVALLGATISPYTMFWQTQGEKEEDRPGSYDEQMRTAGLDIGSGVLSGNGVAYFIIVSTAATLYTQHKPIASALDAARGLEPLLGPAAKYLFAAGLIGAGLIAIPVLLASASYAVAGAVGWPHSLSKKPWQNEGFYLILTVALVVGLIIAALGFDPVQLMFWANALQGVLAPILIVLLLRAGNSRSVMGEHPFNLRLNAALALAGIVMFSGAGLLIFGLLTGQGG
jgi:Mn2+/Fe2+ NRAMP family transporter